MAKAKKTGRKKIHPFLKKYGNQKVVIIENEKKERLVLVGKVVFFTNQIGDLIKENKLPLSCDYWQNATLSWKLPTMGEADLTNSFIRRVRGLKSYLIRKRACA